MLPFFLDVPGQRKVSLLNPEFYVRKPTLEPRIPDVPLKEVNTNVSRLICTKKCKLNVRFSKVLSRKVWLVQDIHKLETISGKPSFVGSFEGDREEVGGIDNNFSQFQGISGNIDMGTKGFEELLSASRKGKGTLIGLTEGSIR